MIPLMTPYITPSMRAAVQRTLESRWIGQGPGVEAFERAFSAMHWGVDAVAVGSGTDALHLAYVLAGIKPGDEVVVPLFTCTATSIPLLHMGAKLRFYDVALGSLNGSAETIFAAMTPQTKAVVVVHYGGAVVDAIDRVAKSCAAYGRVLIEDCAQAIGAPKAKRPAGFFGHYSCFSFQAVKHVTTGDGGMLLCHINTVEKAKRLRWFGIDRAAKLANHWANDITELGYKYQMTDIGAAMGIESLKVLPEQIAFRRAMRAQYAIGLPPDVRLIDTDQESACWLCTVAVKRDREGLIRKLAERGIESGLVHYRNDRYTIFAESRGEFPNMDAMDARYLVLPLHMGMTLEDVDTVCEVIREGW